MNKTILLLTSAAALALAAPAFSADKETYKSETKVEKDEKGNYEAKTKTSATDTAGTTTKMEKEVDVEVNADGTTDTTVKTEEVTDPKGLMNKTKVVTKDSAKTNVDGTVDTSHKKTVDGKTVVDEKTKH